MQEISLTPLFEGGSMRAVAGTNLWFESLGFNEKLINKIVLFSLTMLVILKYLGNFKSSALLPLKIDKLSKTSIYLCIRYALGVQDSIVYNLICIKG